MKPTPIDVLRARRAGARDQHRVALVVEGGCMRGVISAGAVTALEHLQLAQRFDAVYGVSAGALDCAYMLAGQAAMGTSIYFEDLPSVHFVRARRMLAARPAIALDHVIDEIVAQRKRLDVAAVEGARPEFHVLATCLEHRALERPHGPLLERLRAAARVPLLSGPPVRINGCRLYDGGLLDPLPVELAIAEGATHVVVVRTRPDGRAVRRHCNVERAILTWLRRAHPETRSMPVVPNGRYERQLATLPAGTTTHGDTQVQVIVPNAPPMSQSEMNPTALRAGAWTGLRSVERVVGERVHRDVLYAHAWAVRSDHPRAGSATALQAWTSIAGRLARAKRASSGTSRSSAGPTPARAV
jgi:predicted patatin/cPLA2 family phospholipase